MNPGINNILPLFVALPLAGAFLISLVAKGESRLADLLGNLTTFLLLGLSLWAIGVLKTQPLLIYTVGGWPPPIGITLVLDSLTVFMLVTVNLVAALVSLYSVNYMERFTGKGKFYTLFLLMVAGMNGVVVTGDLFNLFVFLEIAAVASYALVAFGVARHELEAAFKYAIMGTVGSMLILLAIALLYSYTSTLNIADMALTLAQKGANNIVLMVGALFLMGFGLKAALVPFHAWLPDAHPSAPAPISAMLSGVLIKSLGVYVLCRIFYNLVGLSHNFSSVLMVLGLISMVVGGLLAMGQWDFKRLLAYSSISQIGYIVIALGLGTPLGILGGLLHLFNHSVFKSLLFLNSGAVEYSAGTRDLRQMGGLGEKLPTTAATSLCASMSVAGIPPFGGFWSKLLIVIAMIQAGYYGYAWAAVLVSVLTLAMYTKIQRYAFFGPLKEKYNQIKEVPLLMRVAMVTLAFISLAGGFLLMPASSRIFLGPAARALREGIRYALMVLR
jgi:multicomponent Na+:H+ antiporter subunit D